MLKRIKNLNIVQRLSLIMLLFVLFCQMSGTTSAWLTHTDALNNHFGVKDYYVNILITEPNWSSTGAAQAAVMQPGMDIFKDPRVQNISEENCYIRMKYVILDSSGNEITDSDDDTKARYEAITKSIKYYVDENNFTAYNTTNFILNDGWYYYIGTNTADTTTASNTNCAVLSPLATTEPLFTDVIIPSLRSEYEGNFDSAFTIAVKAQAVFVSGIEGATVSEVAARFTSMDMDDEDDSVDTVSLGRARAAQRLVVYNDVVATGSALSTSSVGEAD